VVMARKNHPLLKQGCDLDTFLSMDHINVAYRQDGSSVIDVALDNLGHKRKVKFHSQHFLTVPSALVKTDMVACLPYHLAKHYDLAMYEMPIEMPKMEYFLYWHVSMDEDHAHRWMREQIMEVSKVYQSN